MIITIHQPQYMPWLGYFDKIRQADIFIILDNVQFKKNEWQNRNRIRTPQGWQWLTVPVIHDFGQKINEIAVNNKEPWRRSHLKAIELNYRKAPFFDEYFHHFENLYSADCDKLVDINVRSVRLLMELFGIKTKVVLAREYEATEHTTLRLVDLCRHFEAKNYLSGEGGEKYLDMAQFSAAGIQVMIQKYKHPIYQQLWTGKADQEFVSHLSAVDLLFNAGPQSLAVLSEGNNVL